MQDHCNCGHHNMMPTLVIAFGLVFFLQATGGLDPVAVNIAWPVIIMMAGVMKLIEISHMSDCC